MKLRITLIAAGLLTALTMSAKYPQPILKTGAAIWGYAYDRDEKKMVLNYNYQDAEEFDDVTGLARVKINGKYYLIDIGGSFVVGPYDSISMYSLGDDHNYVVGENGKEGVVSPKGSIVFPIKFDSIGSLLNGFYEGSLNGEWIYANPATGEITSDYSVYESWKNQ